MDLCGELSVGADRWGGGMNSVDATRPGCVCYAVGASERMADAEMDSHSPVPEESKEGLGQMSLM